MVIRHFFPFFYYPEIVLLCNKWAQYSFSPLEICPTAPHQTQLFVEYLLVPKNEHKLELGIRGKTSKRNEIWSLFARGPQS